MTDLKISKLDSAKRQIEVAIRLYFHFGDPVAIHTLTAAAYNVIRDINKNLGRDPLLIKEALINEFIRPGKRKEFLKKMNEAENFFKHPDRDPGEALAFSPRITELLLWEAGDTYQRLTGELTPLIHLYRGWFIMHHMDVFNEMPEDLKLKIQSVAYKESQRTEYFNDLIHLATKTGIR